MIVVKLAELNAQIQEYSLEDGSTVGDLFEAAGKQFVDGSVSINQRVVSRHTTLHEGDRVFNGKATKGNNTFDVSFAKLGAAVTTLTAQDGQTIRQVLDSGLSASDREQFFRADGKPAYEYRINGDLVEETYVLRASAGTNIRVICSQKVKGN